MEEGELDIVVGTSTFGLGIDCPFARSIVHACIPETLDRFYQEVGRAGRDGRASISLICPSEGDKVIAKELNSKKVLTVKKGLKRYKMFSEKELSQNKKPTQFLVRIDTPPGYEVDDIDMENRLNTTWNLRTLILMQRAQLITMTGYIEFRENEGGEWHEIEIIEKPFFQKEMVGCSRVIRAVIKKGNKTNLLLMKKFLKDKECPNNFFVELYGEQRWLKNAADAIVST